MTYILEQPNTEAGSIRQKLEKGETLAKRFGDDMNLTPYEASQLALSTLILETLIEIRDKINL